MKSYPKLPTKKNTKGQLKTRKGKILRFKIVDEVRRTQRNSRHKKICLQKIVFDNGRVEFRLAYYMTGKKPRMKGRWVFGQYATLMPEADFRSIIRRAKRKGWI